MPSVLTDDIRYVTVGERRPSGAEIAVPLREKLAPTLARVEKELIRAALRDHRGRLDKAAKALGISRKGLYLKRHRLGL